MTSRLPTRSARIVLAAVLIGLLAPVAGAQSQSELRRENQRLQTEAADLQRELDAARQRIADLEAEVARLAGAVRTGRPTIPPVTPPKVTVDESKADASPRALFNAVVRSYESQTANLDLGTDENDSKRIVYMRDINRWASRLNRELKTKIDWHVLIIGRAVPVRRGYVVRLQAVDPVTGTELGDSFDALLSHVMASRLHDREERFGLEETMRLRGTLLPRIHINPQRDEEGPFNNPPFIGAFAEFAFAVEAKSLTVPKEEKPAAPAPANP
jgi:hypothetical protein